MERDGGGHVLKATSEADNSISSLPCLSLSVTYLPPASLGMSIRLLIEEGVVIKLTFRGNGTDVPSILMGSGELWLGGEALGTVPRAAWFVLIVNATLGDGNWSMRVDSEIHRVLIGVWGEVDQIELKSAGAVGASWFADDVVLGRGIVDDGPEAETGSSAVALAAGLALGGVALIAIVIVYILWKRRRDVEEPPPV
jgi:hypothetical protein